MGPDTVPHRRVHGASAAVEYQWWSGRVTSHLPPEPGAPDVSIPRTPVRMPGPGAHEHEPDQRQLAANERRGTPSDDAGPRACVVKKAAFPVKR